MSAPERQTPATSSYFCHNCATIGTDAHVCSHCQSEFLEEVPGQTATDEQTMSDNDESELPLVRHFETLLQNGFDLQAFTNSLLPMLVPTTQSDLFQPRHRRARPPRRIKRVTHPHRYLPFRSMTSPTVELRLFNIQDRRPTQPNLALFQFPLQLIVFDQSGESLTQLLHEGTDTLPLTRDEINQLTTVTSKLDHLFVARARTHTPARFSREED